MQLLKTNNYIDVQDWAEIKRYNLQRGVDVQELQELTKAGMELAIMNPWEVVDSDTMTVIQ